MVIHYPESDIIAYKSILFRLIRLTDIWNDVKVEIIFIPLLDFISRQIFLPGLNAFAGRFRQRISSKPTIMYDLRYHRFNSLRIYCLNGHL